jgi:catechol 2,3-dioxygenase
MATEPLNVEALRAEPDRDPAPWAGIDPGTDVAHVHLQVSDLARAEAFYGGLLGLEVTRRGYPGALFLSAGGYHHHLGLNVWAGLGAPPPSPETTGLLSFALQVPDGEVWRALVERVRAAGLEVKDRRQEGEGVAALVQDPDGTLNEIGRSTPWEQETLSSWRGLAKLLDS